MKGGETVNDEKLIGLFEARSERGIEEANRAYGGLCRSIAMHILSDSRDAEECVNDALLHVWNAIPPQKPQKFSAFFASVTRNLALNRYAANRAQRRGGGQVPLVLEELSECISAPERTEQVIDRMALHDTLESFLRSLPPKQSKVFMRRYFSMMSVADIAAEMKISESTVKSILRRTRTKLHERLEKEELL